MELDKTERRATERNWHIVEAVGQIAENRNISYSQIGLAWLRAKPVVASVILGARTLAQLKDNLGASVVELTQEEMHLLDTASRLPDLYPYSLIEAYGQREL